MSEIIKIALLGIAGVLFAIQFRQQRPEYTLLIGFALSVLVFSYVLGLTGQLLEEFAGLQQYLGDAKGYLGILMKVVGITYLCEFSAGICKDAGFAAVSDQIEILGKLSVLVAGTADSAYGDPTDLWYFIRVREQWMQCGRNMAWKNWKKGCRSCFRPPGSPWRN